MAISFFNKTSQGGGGDGSSLNIFTQLTEPTIKKGIWLQADKTPEHYIYDEDVFIGGEWMEDGIKTNPPSDPVGGTVTNIGEDIYLIRRNCKR